MQDGDLQAVDIYNIIKAPVYESEQTGPCRFGQVPDFAADLKEKTGRSMYKFLMPLGLEMP